MAGQSDNLDQFTATDTGGRNPIGWQAKVIFWGALAWAFFQLYIASAVPFWVQEHIGFGVVTNSDARRIHLAFGLFLAAMAFPLAKSGPTDRIPWYDWVLAALGVIACLWAVVFRNEIAVRAGLPTTGDLVISTIGMTVVLVTVYRALGLPLVIVACVFLGYTFFGDARWLPDVMQWKGASYGKAMWHYWMQGEGVFGVALSVSTSLIFLFVLFGSILEKAGAGNYFIKVSFALMGHLRGGPAKAAVVASAMSGLYSGSSIANTVTTGTFTIPLMKRTGFSAEKAGAVEVASSTKRPADTARHGCRCVPDGRVHRRLVHRHHQARAGACFGQLHRAGFTSSHLEAMKMGLQGLPKPSTTATIAQKLIGVSYRFSSLSHCWGWRSTSEWAGSRQRCRDMAFPVVIALCTVGYLLLLWRASRLEDLVVDDPNAPITEFTKGGADCCNRIIFHIAHRHPDLVYRHRAPVARVFRPSGRRWR